MKPFSKALHPDKKDTKKNIPNSGRGTIAPASPLHLNLSYRLPVVAFCLFIFWQSSFPSLNSLHLFPHADKLMHLGAYAFLAFLAARNLKQEKPFFTHTKLRILAILFAAIYGFSDEFHQAFVPSRVASGWDFAADASGSILGACFYLDFFSKKKIFKQYE